MDAARVPRKERPALGQEDRGGDKGKHHLFEPPLAGDSPQVKSAMRVRQITGHLIQLTRLHFVNAYLVREDDAFTLVDTLVSPSRRCSPPDTARGSAIRAR